ncbi:unnamed protein product [Ceratitis capitata]|uniref:(Mediterranean fruit fly) hypothetical protein n=1 Tax=Ceratitis capitata TaxID=7213 RepID=A0A811U1B0_CERCA|nr:unnamed protein product [Ceratitis capitata]
MKSIKINKVSVKQLGNKSVSWVRVRDGHILTVDRYMLRCVCDVSSNESNLLVRPIPYLIRDPKYKYMTETLKMKNKTRKDSQHVPLRFQE